LTPTPDGIDVARLLFRAGQASVPRRGWAWPAATGASALLAATLAALLVLRPVPQPAERVIVERVPAPPTERAVPVPPPAPDETASVPAESDQPREDGDYLQLRREVLARGVEALPPPAPWPDAAPADPDGAPAPWSLRLKRALQTGDAS
ncbi:MAG TPA: hypothetical protein VJ739_08085, partial [Gemmataceae bacterium]|nr:hypothetical protein [Gemmataceae bacterium]